jgi:hypothetical protein
VVIGDAQLQPSIFFWKMSNGSVTTHKPVRGLRFKRYTHRL